MEGQQFCAGPKTRGFSCLLECQPSWPAIDKALFFGTRNASRLPPDPREPRGPTHDCQLLIRLSVAHVKAVGESNVGLSALSRSDVWPGVCAQGSSCDNHHWINQLSNTTIWWLDICCLLHRYNIQNNNTTHCNIWVRNLGAYCVR